ncbi:MAG: DUF1353 domain-containing protein [Gammaproteobacteria bacterium]|nr:DUF1353 domain-containing protein [Gammaproteobacteria bacterium]
MTAKDIQFGTLVLYDHNGVFELGCNFVVTAPKETYTAPKGMETDGASIPRFFWRLVGSPLSGKYRQAAVIHDAGYLGVLRWWSGAVQKNYTRKEVDDLFLVLMEALGVSWWRRRAMHLAVRWFGGSRFTS